MTKGYTPHEVQIMAYAASGSRYILSTGPIFSTPSITVRRLEQYVAQQSFGNAPRRVARHSSTRPAPPLAATACCKLAAAPVGWCGLTQMAPPYLSAVCARRGCRGGRAPAARRARRRQVSAGCRRGIGRHRGARHPVPQRLLSLSGCGWRGRAGCMHGNSQCTT